MKRVVPFLLLVSVVLVACGGETTAGGHDHAGDSQAHDQGTSDEGTVPGKPAAAADADREVKVVASDELRFNPDAVQVKAGEIVTFVVTNEGNTDHEFVLGDAAYQAAHEEAHSHGMSMQNAVTVKPGETQTLTWQFTDRARVLYGCHVPGHYDGGMVGTIQVT